MNNFGLKHGKRKKNERCKVSDNIKNQLSRIPSKYYPSMRGLRHNVEVVTPFSLFPNANKLQTMYRIAL